MCKKLYIFVWCNNNEKSHNRKGSNCYHKHSRSVKRWVMQRSGECGIACRTQRQQKLAFQLTFLSVLIRSLSVYNSSCYFSSNSIFSSNRPPPCNFHPFQVSCWQAQRIWVCCGDNCSSAVLLISTAHLPLPSPAAPSPPFLCWQKPVLDGVSFSVMYLSHQRQQLFSHTLQGPLTLRFIVSVEAEFYCLLWWCIFTDALTLWSVEMSIDHQ